MKTILFLTSLLVSIGFSAQRILIVNGHLHPVVGQEITASLLEIVDGKITGIKCVVIANLNTAVILFQLSQQIYKDQMIINI